MQEMKKNEEPLYKLMWNSEWGGGKRSKEHLSGNLPFGNTGGLYYLKLGLGDRQERLIFQYFHSCFESCISCVYYHQTSKGSEAQHFLKKIKNETKNKRHHSSTSFQRQQWHLNFNTMMKGHQMFYIQGLRFQLI